MKYLLSLFFLVAILNFSNAQNELKTSDYNEIISNVKLPYETYLGLTINDDSKSIFPSNGRRYYFIDYIIDNYLDSIITIDMIANRNFLTKLKAVYRTNDEIIIADSVGKLNIRINIKKTRDSSFNFVVPILEMILSDTINTYQNKNGNMLFGFNPVIEVNSYIEQISIDINGINFETPDEAISNLYSPNFTDRVVHISPIEAYYSGDKELLYLYIFGYYYDEEDELNSYLAKLIYDQKQGYLGKIVVSEKEFRDFNCRYSDFIGF